MSAQLKDLTCLNQPSPARSGMVKISYGVHNLEAAIAGKYVREVRQSLKEPLNIDPRAGARRLLPRFLTCSPKKGKINQSIKSVYLSTFTH